MKNKSDLLARKLNHDKRYCNFLQSNLFNKDKKLRAIYFAQILTF